MTFPESTASETFGFHDVHDDHDESPLTGDSSSDWFAQYGENEHSTVFPNTEELPPVLDSDRNTYADLLKEQQVSHRQALKARATAGVYHGLSGGAHVHDSAADAHAAAEMQAQAIRVKALQAQALQAQAMQAHALQAAAAGQHYYAPPGFEHHGAEMSAAEKAAYEKALYDKAIYGKAIYDRAMYDYEQALYNKTSAALYDPSYWSQQNLLSESKFFRGQLSMDPSSPFREFESQATLKGSPKSAHALPSVGSVRSETSTTAPSTLAGSLSMGLLSTSSGILSTRSYGHSSKSEIPGAGDASRSSYWYSYAAGTPSSYTKATPISSHTGPTPTNHRAKALIDGFSTDKKTKRCSTLSSGSFHRAVRRNNGLVSTAGSLADSSSLGGYRHGLDTAASFEKPFRPNHSRALSRDTEDDKDLHRLTETDDARSTLMIRHLPCKLRMNEFQNELADAGFGIDSYYLLYIPQDLKNKTNRGYAFVDLKDPAKAPEFTKFFNGYRFVTADNSGISKKVCSVEYSKSQGFLNLYKQFRKTITLRYCQGMYVCPKAAKKAEHQLMECKEKKDGRKSSEISTPLKSSKVTRFSSASS